MTITREQVADLRPGDVVEMSWPSQNDPDVTVTMRATLRDPTGGGSLCLGCTGVYVRRVGGGPVYGDLRSLTVVSRAPRPLYVNHDRAEPVPGDVVRDADDDSDTRTWQQDGYGQRGDAYRKSSWWSPITMDRCRRDDLPARLRLLVDGETGQVVP